MNRKQILDDAANAVLRDRGSTHGAPENSFGDVAKLWTVFLDRKIEPWQVAIMMGLLKVARAKGNPTNPDNWTDMAGYAACGGELACPDESRAMFGLGEEIPNAAIVTFTDKYTGMKRKANYDNEEDISKRGRIPISVLMSDPCLSIEEAEEYGRNLIKSQLEVNRT